MLFRSRPGRSRCRPKLRRIFEKYLATINLEVENKRLQHLLAAENAAKAAKVYVPGYVVPMTSNEHLRALESQVQYLLEQLHATAIHAQWQADGDIMTETANVAETAMASNSQASANANEPAREEHTLQPRALAKSNAATYDQAVKRDPSESHTKQSTRTNDFGGDHLDNAASPSATVGSEPAIVMSPNVLRHNLADNAKAAAIQAAADAAAAAATSEPRILRAVLLAAAATAKALAQSIPSDTLTAHRRGGRPTPTKPRANPRPRRRTRRPTGMHTGTPTAAGTNRQSSQQSAFAKSPPRAGQARPQP